MVLLKKLLSFTLLLAAITMTGGCLNQDKEESKEIVQAERQQEQKQIIHLCVLENITVVYMRLKI